MFQIKKPPNKQQKIQPSSFTCQINASTAAGFTHNRKWLILPWIGELNWLSLAILSLMCYSKHFNKQQI